MIAENEIARDPGEPDYLRWRAEMFRRRATVFLGTGPQREADEALRGYVESMQAVDRMVGNAVTRQDLAAPDLLPPADPVREVEAAAAALDATPLAADAAQLAAIMRSRVSPRSPA